MVINHIIRIETLLLFIVREHYRIQNVFCRKVTTENVLRSIMKLQ